MSTDYERFRVGFIIIENVGYISAPHQKRSKNKYVPRCLQDEINGGVLDKNCNSGY